MIGTEGWCKNNIWEHSAIVRELYTRRCRLEATEMTCHAQAASLLEPHVARGDTLLDAGCGSGYFYHSLCKREYGLSYLGIDATECLIDIGKKHLPSFGLSADNLRTARIEDLDGTVDHVICINVLSNIDNYHRPLERLLQITSKTLILRESCKDVAEYRYVKDRFLDDGVNLNVHVNTYSTSEFVQYIESHGFEVTVVQDEWSGCDPEMVIGYPHYWKFFVGVRNRVS